MFKLSLFFKWWTFRFMELCFLVIVLNQTEIGFRRRSWFFIM